MRADRATFEADRFLEFPALRWSLSHLHELLPCARVARSPVPGTTGAADPVAQAALDSLTFAAADGRRLDWGASLAATFTDGILVLHRGRCIHERYAGELGPGAPHACFSITKSYVATLAATLVREGVLDDRRTAIHYVPELAGSAFADATLREVMDMQVGIAYAEDYADPSTDFWAYTRAAGMRPFGAGWRGARDIRAYLGGLRKLGEHGRAFAYKSVNTDVLAWIMTRACGVELPDLLSQRLWSPLGCEADAWLDVDGSGVAMAGAGLNACLRDVARFGELMRCDGARGTAQVVPAAVVADIRRGGDPARFAPAGYAQLPGYSYRSMWWISHDRLGAFEARGIHGQRLYVAPAAELVIARFASHPVAASAANDGITMPAFRAVADALLAA